MCYIDGGHTFHLSDGAMVRPIATHVARSVVCLYQTWNWVTGSMGHLGHLSRPGHRVIILTRCETRVFPVFETMPKMQNVHMKC